jgi:hypothetical protein
VSARGAADEVVGRVPKNGLVEGDGEVGNQIRGLCVFPIQNIATSDASSHKMCVKPDKAVLKGRKVYGKEK